jgi:glyceraldehyde 3-phosphate dehydrogenase
VLHEQFGIARGLMTTVHAYTGDQQITDAPHKDRRRARAAALSMVPTSTGAAKAIVKLFPDLEGRLDAVCVRVPTPDGSLVDFTAELVNQVTPHDINEVFRQAASEEPLSPYLRYLGEDELLVSCDFIGDRHSCSFDSALTMVTDNDLVKVFGWYDNEMGYAARLVDLLKLVASLQ